MVQRQPYGGDHGGGIPGQPREDQSTEDDVEDAEPAAKTLPRVSSPMVTSPLAAALHAKQALAPGGILNPSVLSL